MPPQTSAMPRSTGAGVAGRGFVVWRACDVAGYGIGVRVCICICIRIRIRFRMNISISIMKPVMLLGHS